MKKFRGIAILIITCLVVAGGLSACAKEGSEKADNNTNKGTEQNDTADLKGNLTLAGSTSMEKLANVASEAFMNKYPNVLVQAEFIGSSAGVEAVLAKTVDIGNASRNLKETEKAEGAVENIVAIDGIAVIVDKNNTVTDITKDQLTDIYKGTIKNWSEVGGSDQPIVVVGRESGSGTRGAFEEMLEVEDQCAYSNEINSTGGVMAKVASTPGAIGYVSLDILDDTVIAVNLDGVEPTEANIKAGSYFLSRPFVMATVGEISEQSDLVQAFFEFIYSEEGQNLVKEVGLITVE
ncbi:phosphate ABC transporter substrate-binding protein [Mobilitalea sibirica]|uniref:Phosphate-binding protein n=1 Tax=Mobilitalea sibirica TaxID=1462919 RepID=A0A8J7H449_9FIRM|nr:phosphate ABC transporter substrate-binding protein [Mobilitalea sibirica]MBH1941955.1 phosphate ABC transporter substrate-binding protein [Mobilitalea sibirica]